MIQVLFFAASWMKRWGCHRTARKVSKVQWFLEDVEEKGFKFILLRTIWRMLEKLDSGEWESGETAPYCGHAYSRYENKYLGASFHEGDGGGSTKFSVFGYKLYYENIEGEQYFIQQTNK